MTAAESKSVKGGLALSKSDRHLRAQVMVDLHRKRKWSLREIGQHFDGISRQRVHQIIHEYENESQEQNQPG